MWELQEVTLRATQPHANPYSEVVCWIDLEGPGFTRRVYGFWDGGATFKVRFVATAPGEWRWRTGSNQPGDPGLNGGRGQLRAVPWTGAEQLENPNRRGFVRPSANGHALAYADGTPFFLLGDTWLAASTWRLPWRGDAAGRRRRSRSRARLRGSGRVSQAPGLQLDQLHRRVPQLGRGRPRCDVRERRRHLPAQRLGEVRPLGARRGRQHVRWSHDHRQGHGRRAGQPAVRGAGRARRPGGLRPAEPRVLPEPGPQDAAPRGAGLRPGARDRPSRQLPLVEGVLRLRPLVRPLRPVPDRPLRRLQPPLQRHPPRLDPEGVQPDRGRVQRGAHRPLEDLRSAAVRPARHDADRQLDVQALRPRREARPG